MYTQTHVRIDARIDTKTCRHTGTHTHTHTYANVCLHECTYMHTYTHAYIYREREREKNRYRYTAAPQNTTGIHAAVCTPGIPTSHHSLPPPTTTTGSTLVLCILTAWLYLCSHPLSARSQVHAEARISSAAYLASFLARANFVPLSAVVPPLRELLLWADQYQADSLVR